MYKKGSKGWLKHFDFILLDMICLQIAFLLAYVIRHDSGNPYMVPLYRNMAILMELLDLVVMFFDETLSNVLKRGYFKELTATIKQGILVRRTVSVHDAGRTGIFPHGVVSDRCDLCDSHVYRSGHLEEGSTGQNE